MYIRTSLVCSTLRPALEYRNLLSFKRRYEIRQVCVVFRSITKSIQYSTIFCHEQAPVLGTFSFLYYFQQKISQPLITELLEIELKVKAKLKGAKLILPILRPSAAWGSWGSTVTRGGLERYFSVTGQGRKPRPGLGSLPWPAPLRAPFTRAPSRRPSHTRSARWSTTGSPRLQRATEWEE